MAISAGSDIVATDFVSTSAGAGDSGKVAKLNASGQIDRSFLNASFGGTGADGALTITSGTTTVSAASASVLVKNYTSISITGTAKLAFSNPASTGTFIILKSRGNVTLTSSAAPIIDASGMGSAGGAALSVSVNTNGNSGVDSVIFTEWITHAGVGGASPVAGTALSSGYPSTVISELVCKYPFAFVGAGAASGAVTFAAAGTAVSGSGGRGGGALVIECAGAWNFTTASGISVAGVNGGVASGTGSQTGAGGGGGGGGGYFLALVNSITANTGTVVKTGGTGTGQFTSGGQNGLGGPGGGSILAGTIGSPNTSGGTGADGLSAGVVLNTEMV